MKDELPDDAEFADLLDEYVGLLQSGAQPDREKIEARFPAATSMLDCLEGLERLAPDTDAAGGDRTEDEAPASQMPRRFGEYELLEEIGRGGMGVVYKAQQMALDRTVAVKMILSSHLASAEHVRRFQAEARAAARLHHPHIVGIYEVGQLHGQHYFTMAYVEGRSLAQRVAQGRVDAGWAVGTLAAVARAVDYLHRQGVVHRDVKPSNILLDADDCPYVTDFGLAKVFTPGSDMTATGVIAGTPSYMSPEQAGGVKDAGPASDIYSLGAILYELLTGRAPFVNENPLDTLLQVLGSEPQPPRRVNPKVPRGLELICQKCLAKNPADRYASARDLADDLERFLRGEALAARPPHFAQRLQRAARRQPALASHLVALAVYYAVEVANYLLGTVSAEFHLRMSVIIAVWAAASVGCQLLVTRQRWETAAEFLWGAVDAALFLAVLLVGDGVASALVIGYALLIVGSGLWFRVRFVWYMVCLSLVSYAVLVFDFYYRRTQLQEGFAARPDRHAIFAVSLVVLGMLVGYLVQRLRTLSAYYGRRP